VTQQNAALVEENAATAKTLEHQAKAMDERIAFFQTGDSAEDEQAVQHAGIAAPSRGPVAALKKQPVAVPTRVAAAG